MLTGHLCLGSTMLIPPPSLMALEEVKILCNLLSWFWRVVLCACSFPFY